MSRARLVFSALLSLLAFGQMWAQGVVVSESFKNSTVSGWTFAGSGYTPTLTSGTAGANGNATGDGWLRLTDTSGNAATSAYYNTAFNSTNTSVYAKFDFESYGGINGTTNGGDGIVFYLFDGSKAFSVGAYGGSIGYAQKTIAGGAPADINGINGGYIGIALDEFGNFSAGTEGRSGGIGQTTESIAVRGPGQGLTGYDYLGGSTTLAQPLDSATRPSQTNTVQILLNTTNQLSVTLQQGGTSPQTVLQMDLSGYARPGTLMYGFSAGSGNATNFHDIRNLNITTLASTVWGGGSGDTLWANNNNWNPTVVPIAGADLLFNNDNASAAQTVNLGGVNRSVRSATIDAPFNYTFNNGTLTFDALGVAGFSGLAVTSTRGTGTETVNANLAFNNDGNIRNGSASTLNITGAINTNGKAVTLDGTGTSTLSGVVSGAGSLTKNDAGTFTLSGANTYSGGTTLNVGTLNANNGTALGSSSVTLAGGTLASTNSSSVANNIALTGSAALANLTTSGTLTQTGGSFTLNLANATQSGAVNLSNNTTARTLTTQVDSGTSTISGVIANGGGSAGGSVTKEGSGTLVLSGVNTYTGTTTVNGGVLQLAGNDRLAAGSAVNIGTSGTFNLNGNSQKIGTLTAAGGATLDFGTPASANTFVFDGYTAPVSGVLVVNNWQSGSDTFATTVSGQNVSTIYISGFGVAQEAGSRTDNIYGTGVNGAFLLTPVAATTKEWNGSSSASWNTNANWTSSGRPSSSQIALFDGLGTGRSGVTLNVSNTIAGIKFGNTNTAVGYTISGSNTLTLSGTVPYIQQQNNSFNQTISVSTLALSNTTVADVTGSKDLIISSAITGANSGVNLIKDGTGAGKLVLSGNNSGLTGNVYVNNGVLQAGHTNALGTGTTTISDGATLELSGGISPANAVSVTGIGTGGAGAIHNVSGSNTMSGTITEAGGTKFVADTGTTLSLTGNLTGSNTNTTLNTSGTGVINLNQITTGTGTVTVNAGTGTVNYNGTGTANTYTGTTTVNSGTLVLNKTAGTNAVAGNLVIGDGASTAETRLAASNQIADTARVSVNANGTFNLNGQSETIKQIDGAGTVALGTGALTLTGTSTSTLTGVITGSGTLTKNGSLALNLSGNSTGFSGTTNINGGIVGISNSNAALGTGTVNVNPTGSLQLQNGTSSGLTIANAINLNSAGTSTNTAALQNVVGNNTVSGTVTLSGASKVQSDSGTLALTNTVALGANTLTVAGAGNTNISGQVTGTGGLTKNGGGNLTLSNGTNSFSGASVINAGAIVAANNNVINNGGLLTINNGAALSLQTFAQTVGNISGAGLVDFGTSGKLTLASGSTTFSGTFAGTGELIIGAGATLTLGTNFSATNLKITLAGGTLNLNGTTDSFGTLNVTANSILDFASSANSNLTISGISFGTTSNILTVNNWTDGADFFTTPTSPGVQGAAPLNQIVFAGFTGNDTRFVSYDHQLAPVPEPSTYGAILLSSGLLFFGVRRLRRRRANKPATN